MKAEERGVARRKRSGGALVAIGNPLLDACVKVEPEFVAKWRLDLNSQINATDDHMSLFAEVARLNSVEYVPGGCALNTLRVARWMLGDSSDDGVRVNFAGSIGSDEVGVKLRRELDKAKLDAQLVVVDSELTGQAVSLITPGGNRSIVGLIAAADKFTAKNLDDVWPRLVAPDTRIIYLSSWFLLSHSGEANFARLGEFAVANGRHFGLNLSAPMLCENQHETILKMIGYSNLLFGNNTEALALAKSLGWNLNNEEEELEEIAQKLVDIDCKNGQRVVVITSGPRATILATKRFTKRVEVLPIEQDKVLDTTGAGDAFCGGFIASLYNSELDRHLTGVNVEETLTAACDAGNYAAKTVIQRYGCAFPVGPCDYQLRLGD